MVRMLAEASSDSRIEEGVKKDLKMELTRYGGRADVAMRKREELSEVLRFLSCAGTSKGEKGDSKFMHTQKFMDLCIRNITVRQSWIRSSEQFVPWSSTAPVWQMAGP